MGGLRFHIFDDGISESSKDRLNQICEKYGVGICYYDSSPIVERMAEEGVHLWRGRYSTYIKLFLYPLLPEDVERIIVVDADTVVIGDISELNEIDLDGKPCAMALEGISGGYHPEKPEEQRAELFNSGLLIVDLLVWKMQDAEARIIRHMTEVSNRYMLTEEDIISLALRNDIKRLSPKWNYIAQWEHYATKAYFKWFQWDELGDKMYTLEEVLESKKDPRILHCIDMFTSRPWFRENIHPFTPVYDKYLALTPWKDEPKKEREWSRVDRLEYLLKNIFRNRWQKPFMPLLRVIFIQLKQKSFTEDKCYGSMSIILLR